MVLGSKSSHIPIVYKLGRLLPSAMLPRKIEMILHFDRTTAVEPLERTSLWETGELRETYPFAL